MVAVEEISLRIVDVAAERGRRPLDRQNVPVARLEADRGGRIVRPDRHRGRFGQEVVNENPVVATDGQQRRDDRRQGVSRKKFPHYVGKYNEKSGACYPPHFFSAAADFMARTDVSQSPAIPVRNHPAAQRHSRR